MSIYEIYLSVIYNIRAEIVDEVRALRTLEYMTEERDYLPWSVALTTRLPYIKRMLHSTSAFKDLQVIALSCFNHFCWQPRHISMSRPLLQTYTCFVCFPLQTFLVSIIKPTYNYVGWNNEDPDEHLEKYNTTTVFQ